MLRLIIAEWKARRAQRVPFVQQLRAIYDPLWAWWHDAEFVGAQGGLQWTGEDWE